MQTESANHAESAGDTQEKSARSTLVKEDTVSEDLNHCCMCISIIDIYTHNIATKNKKMNAISFVSSLTR
jgi:hypothetical protein